jgi:hypothetical protein
MVNGDKHWYKKGVCHRDNKPAIEYIDKNKNDVYYFNGIKINVK